MLLPARGSGGLLVVSNDSGHDKQNFTGGQKCSQLDKNQRSR